MADPVKRDEKYDIRKLRQELNTGSIKYEFPSGPGKAPNGVGVIPPSPSPQPQSISPTVSRQRMSVDGRAPNQGLPQIKTSDSTQDQLSSRLENATLDNGEESDRYGGGRNADDDGEEGGDMPSKFFSGFKDLYGFIKSSISTMKRHTKMIRSLDNSVKDLQSLSQNQQDELSILTVKVREIEQQIMGLRMGDTVIRGKGKDGAGDGDFYVGGGLLAQPTLLNSASPRNGKKQTIQQVKENRARDQDLKEVISKFEHQIADIHIDLSKKQANMDRQSFQIHTMKEKMESLDMKDEFREVKRLTETQGNSLKVLQGQMTEILSDTRIPELQTICTDLNGKLSGLQSRTNTWFTDLSAQFGMLKEEAAQHKNTIYEKLYERVREDIARQTNRCFKELKMLSDHCNEKFEIYDSEMAYLSEQVPKKVNKDELVSGLSDVEIAGTTNFRAILVSQILNEIQESFDGTVGFAASSEPFMVVAESPGKKGGAKRQETPQVASQSRDTSRPITSTELSNTKSDNSQSRSRTPAVLKEETMIEEQNIIHRPKTTTPKPGAGNKIVSDQQEPLSPAPARMMTDSHKDTDGVIVETGDEYTNDDDGFLEDDEEEQRPRTHSNTPDTDTRGNELTSEQIMLNEGMSKIVAGSVNANEQTATSKDGKAQPTVHMASQIQTVLTKFYGVMEFDSGEQLKNLLNQVIQRLQRLHTVVNLKMFRHEGRIELEKKLSASIFEQVMMNLVHQLKHNQLDITLEIPRSHLSKSQAKTSGASKLKGDKMPSITPTKRANTTTGGKRDVLGSKADYFPSISLS